MKDVTDEIDNLLTKSDQENLISGQFPMVTFGGSHIIRYDQETKRFIEEWRTDVR
jgi:hypothetical protein